MNRKFAAALALAASLAVPSSHAQSIARENFYAGVSAAQSRVRDCGLPGCDDQDLAWRLFGGYQVNRYFSAELGHHDFGKAGFARGDIKSNAWELVGVGSWPITEQVSLYGKLGGYRGETQASGLVASKGRNTDVTYGAGVQYDVNRNVGLRAEWQRYPKLGGPDLGGERDVDVIGVAVLWRFR